MKNKKDLDVFIILLLVTLHSPNHFNWLYDEFQEIVSEKRVPPYDAKSLFKPFVVFRPHALQWNGL
jgi:hypothetical protein